MEREPQIVALSVIRAARRKAAKMLDFPQISVFGGFSGRRLGPVCYQTP
jgi:hypothetical protein